MTRFRWLFLLLALPALQVPLHGQTGNTITIRFAGVPTGTCFLFEYGVNNATGDFYDCKAGSWNEVSGGGGGSGTVTSFSAGNLSPLFTTSVATATTTPALSFSLTNAGAGTIFGNNMSSSAAPAYTAAPALGVDASTAGTLTLSNGAGGGAHTIFSSAATTTNTIAGFTVVPTTGHIVTCTVVSTTCTLTDGGSPGAGSVTSVVIAGTANQITASGTCTITSTGTCTLSQPNAVILGTDNSAAGTLQLANSAANAHTIWSSGATTTNTIAGFTAVPTTTHLVTCTVVSTTCTLTDGGAEHTGTVTSIATTSPITGGIITTTGTIACGTCATTTNGGALSGTSPVTVSAAGAIGCATCVTSASALTSNAVVIGGGLQASSTISADSTTTHALFATAGAPAFRAIASGDLPTLSTTANGQTCTIGSTCNVNVGATAHSTAVNEGNGSALAGAGPGTSGQCFLSGGASVDPTFGTCPGGSGLIGSTAPTVTVTSSTPAYVPLSGGGVSSTTEANVQQAAPAAATVSNLHVQVSLAAGAGNSFIITLRDATVSQAVTCTISGASATSCNDTTDTFTPAAGDLLDWQISATGTIVVTPNLLIAAQWGGSITAGSVNNCATAGAIGYYASTGTAISCLATVVEAAGAITLGTDNSVDGTLQTANANANAHTIWGSGATTSNTIKGFTAVPTSLQLVQCTVSSTTCTLTGIDFPDMKEVPAANCNNATAGAGWSIGSGGTVSCRAGTNNKGGFIAITDTASTFATFQIDIPDDWDPNTLPYIRVKLASTDATNGHTIIPSESVACYKGDGTTTDDVAPNATRSLSTVTLNGNANRFWSTSNLQLNSTDMTGCTIGSTMQFTIGRATDTATNAEFYSATISFPRLPVVQAN